MQSLCWPAGTGKLALPLVVLLLPTMALANVVWPALYAETKVSSLPIIALSLVIEFFVIRKLFDRSIMMSCLMVVVANLASGFIGLLPRIYSGIAWEVTGGILVQLVLGWHTFNPIAWFFVPVIGGAINGALELLALKLIWRVEFSKRNFGWLWAANWATVGIATVWVILYPPQL